MTAPERSPFDISQVLERFPGDAALAARLLVQDDGFRAVCEDLVLAKTTLTKLEPFQRRQEPTKIAEYRQLVTELESEIAGALEHAKRAT